MLSVRCLYMFVFNAWIKVKFSLQHTYLSIFVHLRVTTPDHVWEGGVIGLTAVTGRQHWVQSWDAENRRSDDEVSEGEADPFQRATRDIEDWVF